MERTKISVQIKPEDKQKIQEAIKREYPKLKTVSDVVRSALTKFLNETS
jgi:Arc/MetJ-type ribon-helix-helix transcriptional regulator